MTTIQLTLNGAQAVAQVDGLLTSGMVGIPVTIEYDQSWEGLTKTLVCKNGNQVRRIHNVGTSATVALGVLDTAQWVRSVLYLGVEGRDGTGKLVLPSTYAYCGVIQPGAEGDCPESVEPENPAWARILGQIGDLSSLTTQRRDSLVAAINDAAASGGDAVESLTAHYQCGDDGQTIPTGTWSDTYPETGQGRFLWTKLTLHLRSGGEKQVYLTTRMADGTGNATLSAQDVGALPLTGGTMTGPVDMGGQSLGGLPEPSAADQAAGKGYVDQGDQAARGYTDSRLLTLPPVNLLDNTDFTKTINQRRKTSYKFQDTTEMTFCIDRWKLCQASLVRYANYARVSTSKTAGVKRFCQTLDRKLPAGTSYTIAMKAKVKEIGGSVLLRPVTTEYAAISGVTPLEITATTTDYEIFLMSFTVRTSIEYPCVELLAQNAAEDYYNMDIVWMACYPGVYTAQTLPQYIPKSRAEEQLVCWRYFYSTAGGLLSTGYLTGARKNLYLGVPLPVPMREQPTIVGIPTIEGVRTTAGSNMDAVVTAVNILTTEYSSANSVCPLMVDTETFNSDAYTNNTPVVVAVSGLTLSAEL